MTTLVWAAIIPMAAFFSCQNAGGDSGSAATVAFQEGGTAMADSVPGDAYGDTVGVAYLTGKFDPAGSAAFDEVPLEHASRAGMLLRVEVLESLLRMIDSAAAAGHRIRVLSATRNFEYQRGIWEAKWRGDRLLSDGKNAREAFSDPVERARAILLYSSMPGTSRHHWGTDFDINAFENSYFERGEGARLFAWLEKHAGEFGFCRPYTAKGAHRPSGYEEEKWHWSYVPISAGLTAAARRLLRDGDISGFEGSEAAAGIEVVRHYVLGVDPACFHEK